MICESCYNRNDCSDYNPRLKRVTIDGRKDIDYIEDCGEYVFDKHLQASQ